MPGFVELFSVAQMFFFCVILSRVVLFYCDYSFVFELDSVVIMADKDFQKRVLAWWFRVARSDRQQRLHADG